MARPDESDPRDGDDLTQASSPEDPPGNRGYAADIYIESEGGNGPQVDVDLSAVRHLPPEDNEDLEGWNAESSRPAL